MLERWTLAVLRARALVIAAWLVIFAAGVFAATQLPALLATSFDVPGTESERARELLEEHFDERPEGTFVVVFRGDPSDKVLRRRLNADSRSPRGRCRPASPASSATEVGSSTARSPRVSNWTTRSSTRSRCVTRFAALAGRARG